MKNVFNTFFSSLPVGARLLVLCYALGYPLALAGHYTHSFELMDWLALVPALVWKGEVWTTLTYAFVGGGPVDWAVSLFWLATLVAVLGRHWSGLQLWLYCLLCTLVGALILCVVRPQTQMGLVGNPAMIFGLLAAWYRLYGRERLILLGIGEVSVRQAAILVAIIEVLILVFCVGILVTLAMMFGGAAGWFYLFVRGKSALNRRSQPVDSERIARLEL
jgi:membrane associated rhomboid family serine protease